MKRNTNKKVRSYKGKNYINPANYKNNKITKMVNYQEKYREENQDAIYKEINSELKKRKLYPIGVLGLDDLLQLQLLIFDGTTLKIVSEKFERFRAYSSEINQTSMHPIVDFHLEDRNKLNKTTDKDNKINKVNKKIVTKKSFWRKIFNPQKNI